MGCKKSLSLNLESTGDMALDQAVYESNTQKIFGVRGQWIFKCSSVTGDVEASMRFVSDATCTSCITTIGGTLYCGVLYTPTTDYLNGNAPNRDIFIVDAASFTVVGRFNLGPVGLTTGNMIGAGYRFLVNDGVHIAGWTWEGSNTAQNTTNWFDFLPSNMAGTFNRDGGSTHFVDDVTYDPVHSCYWCADSASPDIFALQNDPIFSNYAYTTGPSPNDAHGICYNQAQNKVYVATGGVNIYMISSADVNAAFPLGPGTGVFNINTISTGSIASNAYRIKSVNNLVGNPYNGKVLIPTWNGDTVIVWNPATDTVVGLPLTGFTAPFDIVITPTKCFALQTGPVGLKALP